jgi:CRP-like cAMP-binding protein
VAVQVGGQAERMDAAVLQREARQNDHFRRLLHLYVQAFMTQIAQSTACNRLHAAEQRLARWLLICRDRVGRDEMPITQETMAVMLGVRRATVTEAASGLQRQGLIRYRRGVVAVVDRPGLEAATCECYQIVREEFDRLLGVRVG